jgi:hypothetical protein
MVNVHLKVCFVKLVFFNDALLGHGVSFFSDKDSFKSNDVVFVICL